MHRAFPILCGTLCLLGLTRAAVAEDAGEWKILIRPRNYDFNDQWEYTRLQGMTHPGMPAAGAVWNRVGGRSPYLAGPAIPNTVAAKAAASAEEPAPGDTEEQRAPEQPAPEQSAAAMQGPMMPMIPIGGIGPTGLSYPLAYAAVPFSRTEYEANPAYRQETAMELMFGTMRPMTVNKMNIPYYSRYPDFYRFPYSRFPNYYRVDATGLGGGGGYGPFGYPFNSAATLPMASSVGR